MIQMCYRRSGQLQGWELRRNLATATKSELFWYYFPGEVEISTGKTTVRTPFEWVPAIHFVSAQLRIANGVAQGEDRQEYHFTESSDWILYQLGSGRLEITFSYSSHVLSTACDEFADEAKSFAKRTITQLASTYPQLLEIASVVELLSAAS